MISKNQIKLKESNILTVPIQTFESDFTFIVNGEEFKTNRLETDLISSKICRTHAIDPLFNTYEINTQYRGNFSKILGLINFESNEINDDELPFII